MADNSILLGNRSVSVLDANGNPVSGEEAARIAIPGMQQAQAAGAGGGGVGGFRDRLTQSVAGLMDMGTTPFREVMGGNVNPVDIMDKMRARVEAPSVTSQGAARIYVPQTPAAAATLALGGPAAKSLGLVKGAGAMAAGGAALNAATGGSPTEGAVTGAGGTLIPPAVSAATNKIAEAGQKFVTSSGVRSIAEDYAGRVLNGLKEDVPALYNVIRNAAGSAPAKVQKMFDPAVWDDAMGGMMRKAEDPIIKAVPQIPSPVQAPPAPYVYPGATPEQAAKLAALGVPPPGASVHSVGPARPVMMKMEDALAKLKQLKSEAREAWDPDNPAASKPLRDAANEWEAKLTTEISQRAPGLASAWKDAMAQYNRGIRYQELAGAAFRNAPAVAGGTPFDETGMIRHYLSSPGAMKRYAESQLPGFHRFMFPGETGASPVITDPGLYARMFGPAGVKANLPSPKFATVPGQQYGAPDLAEILGNAARAGVVNLSPVR